MILMVSARTTTLKKKASTPWARREPAQAVVLDLHVGDLEGHADDEGEVEEVPVVRFGAAREVEAARLGARGASESP